MAIKWQSNEKVSTKNRIADTNKTKQKTDGHSNTIKTY